MIGSRVASLRLLVGALAVVGVLAVVGSLAGCGDDDGAQGGNGRRLVVRMSDHEFTMPSAFKGGALTFQIANQSTAHVHELVVLATEFGARQLPVTADAKVDMSAPGIRIVGRVEEVPPGREAELSVELPAGRYVFVCNTDDHYRQGMSLAVTVS